MAHWAAVAPKTNKTKYQSQNAVTTGMLQYELMTGSTIVQCLVKWLYQENSPKTSKICIEHTFLFLVSNKNWVKNK
jgi:hypothetical protein